MIALGILYTIIIVATLIRRLIPTLIALGILYTIIIVATLIRRLIPTLIALRILDTIIIIVITISVRGRCHGGRGLHGNWATSVDGLLRTFDDFVEFTAI